MISLKAFLDGIASIVAERPTYRLGYDGSNGLCDCVGLVIGGVRRAGGTWTGAHGTNWAARNAVSGLCPIGRPALGMVVFKAREPGDAGYNLPHDYDAHPDRLDYYHVGVVTSTSPLRVTHCTRWAEGDGIKVDNLETTTGGWTHEGRVSSVDYDGTEEAVPVPVKMFVTAEVGNTVNLRAKPSLGSITLARVPVGDTVLMRAAAGEWRQVTYGGKTGYMMAEFLVADEPATDDPIEDPLEEVRALLTKALEILGN